MIGIYGLISFWVEMLKNEVTSMIFLVYFLKKVEIFQKIKIYTKVNTVIDKTYTKGT